MPIQKIDYNQENRVETGAVQFGDDWTGLFIRGDDCVLLQEILTKVPVDIRYCNLVNKLYQEIRLNVLRNYGDLTS